MSEVLEYIMFRTGELASESDVCNSLSSLFLFSALAKSEHKIVQDLQNSGLCQNEEDFRRNIEEWERSLESLDRHRNELVRINMQLTFCYLKL